MQDLKLLTFTDLIDLLVEQTERHLKLIDHGNKEQLSISGEFLRGIQKEIILRKKELFQEAISPQATP